MSVPLSPTCSKHSAMVSVKTSSPACCLLPFCLCTMSYCYCWMCLFHLLVVHGLIKKKKKSYCVFLPEIIHPCYIWTVESILHKRLEDWCTFLRNRNKPLHDSRYLIIATFVHFPEKAQKCSYVPFTCSLCPATATTAAAATAAVLHVSAAAAAARCHEPAEGTAGREDAHSASWH